MQPFGGPAPTTTPVAVKVLPSGATAMIRAEDTVADALERAGFSKLSPCAGNGTCGKCRVRVQDADRVPATPHAHISEHEARRGVRLACQVRPVRDLSVEVTEDWRHEQRPSVLRGERNPGLLRNAGGYGLALDLGTTTVVATLVSLPQGDELCTVSTPNPQSRFGSDVMTRIQKGSSPDGLAELNGAIHDALGAVVTELCTASRADPRAIRDVVVGGNPAMLQLAAGIDPAPLGETPFRVGIEGGRTFSAETFGLQLGPAARAYVPPITHAFVGSDISAGLLVADGFFQGAQSILFVDIGTNGELVMRSDQGLLATSTAAGPAFEGGGLRSGMSALPGAVSRVWVESGDLGFDCIDDATPRGLCGSGVVDLVAALLELGVLDPTGRLVRARDAESVPESVRDRLIELDGRPAVRIADGVVFTQEDVREVQLAKSAIRTGIDLLLHLGTSRPARLILAGAFGTHLRVESLAAIGMLPPALIQGVAFAGNTSRAGCVRLLQNSTLRQKLEARMQSVQYMSLVERPEYMDRYVTNMEFPCPPAPSPDAP